MLRGSTVYIVTKNAGKLREVELILGRYGFSVAPFAAEKLEIQSDSLEEIVEYAAERLAGSVPEPFVVEDSGLFVEHLRGFPGPFSSYVYRTIGCTGLLKLLENASSRRARFVCAAALCVKGDVRIFTGEVRGTISLQARGSSGFGFDPIFVPEGCAKTFAEMSIEEKCAVSHRARAFTKLAKYLSSGGSLSEPGPHRKGDSLNLIACTTLNFFI